MATSKDYLAFILDQLSALDGLAHRQMMGEYILYLRGKIAAYLCDERFFVRSVPTALDLLPNAPLEPPYEGAKPMLVVENVDDRDFLRALLEGIWPELPEAKKKK